MPQILILDLQKKNTSHIEGVLESECLCPSQIRILKPNS